MRRIVAMAWMGALALAGGLAAAPARAAEPCAALAGLKLDHVVIASAQVVPAGPAAPMAPGAPPGPMLPAYCKVLGAAHPTGDSDIRFEVAIPEGPAWNGRYLQVGNGGFAGAIPEAYMGFGLAAGYAVAGTDDGHESSKGTDASWALGHPEKVVDFGYRALKETTDAAKAIIAAYGGAPKYSYFAGCSDGGREALMEAQRYPDDFDGIVSGDPANAWTRLIVGADAIALALQAPGGYVGPNKLAAIEAAALHACGDQDGVIEDPLACHFDPAILTCAGPETDQCLTTGEVATVRSIYAGEVDPASGARIGWGLDPGGEAEKHGWADWITGAKVGDITGAAAYGFGSNFYRYVQFQDPNHPFPDASLIAAFPVTDAKFAGVLNAYDPDLTAFRKHGGKLIQYHGWSDPAIPARESLDYYQLVQKTMGDTRDFYRLFMAPGMLHCGGGAGPNVLPTLKAIAAWVEQGQAPDSLIAVKFKNNDPAQGVERTRPVCAYPSQARWDGQGERDQAESWRCVAPAPS